MVTSNYVEPVQQEKVTCNVMQSNVRLLQLHCKALKQNFYQKGCLKKMDDFEKVNVPSETESPSLFNLFEVISAVT